VTFFIACFAIDEERLTTNQRLAAEKAEELSIIAKEAAMVDKLRKGEPILPSIHERSDVEPPPKLTFTTPAVLVLNYIDKKQAKLIEHQKLYRDVNIHNKKKKKNKNRSNNQGVGAQYSDQTKIFDAQSCFVEAYALTYQVSESEVRRRIEIEKQQQQQQQQQKQSINNEKRRNHFASDDEFSGRLFSQSPPPYGQSGGSPLALQQQSKVLLLKSSDFAYWFRTNVHGAVAIKAVKTLWDDSFKWLQEEEEQQQGHLNSNNQYNDESARRRRSSSDGSGVDTWEDTRMNVNDFCLVVAHWREQKLNHHRNEALSVNPSEQAKALNNNNNNNKSGSTTSSVVHGGAGEESGAVVDEETKEDAPRIENHDTRRRSSTSGAGGAGGAGSSRSVKRMNSLDRPHIYDINHLQDTVDLDSFLEEKDKNSAISGGGVSHPSNLPSTSSSTTRTSTSAPSSSSSEESSHHDQSMVYFEKTIHSFMNFADTKFGKWSVMIFFTVLTAYSCYSASLIEEKFDGAMVMPDDS
jgi:hypothetical protein